MSESTQYLYEYKNGKRVRNLGFMKIDQQRDKWVIQIYGKDMDEVKGIILRNPNGECYQAGWELERKEVVEKNSEMEVEEFIIPSNSKYEKIQRQDLSRLPRKEWRVANNHFLLHGYYNYHHLLYIEEEGEIWVGVPGIYHEKEKQAAQNFGFTDFRRIADVDIELEENETNAVEDFGYWCRQIEKPKV